MIALTVMLFVSVVTAVPPFHPSDTTGDTKEEQKLQIISSSKVRVEARFYTPTGGIHIVSEVHSDGELTRVSITSMNGESMFAVDYPLDHSQGLLTINGNEFVIVNETLSNDEAKLTAYSVPEAYSHQVKTEMKRHNLPQSLLGQLDRENVNATAHNAIDHLLMRPEVQLIATAAVALGNSGLHGRDNPAAMAFYATALRFATTLSQDTVSTDYEVPNQRNRRSSVYCSNSGSYCSSGYCPTGSSCTGLCGDGCNCWWFVCFDCCWNVGCYYHDVYSCSGGTSTWSCWLQAPVGLVCS